ncbi:hypothetical protein EZV62_011991 [Acer yangbiense]|uniref:Uncharacterized protein n=1 Tax=Acer yangbiense TaxID=1000413 RepID=A0A5C7I786_9ROSI|nr:hypothetical protein EZV62_011991 [Acer yangbiense]
MNAEPKRNYSVVLLAATMVAPGEKIEVEDFEQLVKELEHALALEIMDKALENFGNDFEQLVKELEHGNMLCFLKVHEKKILEKIGPWLDDLKLPKRSLLDTTFDLIRLQAQLDRGFIFDSFFPSRPHPLTSEVDQHLSRLRSSQATSTSSSSSICHEINGLQDLYGCVDKFLQLPLVQQALGQEQQKKWVDELLNGSLRILDISSIVKDALLQTKECVQELSSVLRRRRGDEISSEVKKYLTSRKEVKKTIKKALKGMENKCSSKTNEEHETITMLREVEAATSTVFESMLSRISGLRSTSSKLSGWSLVSKLVQPKRITCEESDMNEFEKVDAALIAHKTSTSDNIIQVFKELESNIQDLEEGLESLSRHLIKSRVSLLNILNN